MTGIKSKKPDQVQKHDAVKEDLQGDPNGPKWQLPDRSKVAEITTNDQKTSSKK